MMSHTFSRIVPVLVVVELIVTALILSFFQFQPDFPEFQSQIVDGLTSKDLNQLRKRLSKYSANDWKTLGEAYLIFGSYRAAEACYRQAEAMSLTSEEVMIGRSLALERMGRTSEAIGVLRRFIDDAPLEMRAEIHYRIGRMLLSEEKPDEAEREFRESSDFVPARYQLALLLIRTGRAEEAAPLVNDLLERHPDVLDIIQLSVKLSQALNEPRQYARQINKTDRSEQRLAHSSTSSVFRELRRQYGSMRMLVEAESLENANRLNEALKIYETVLEHNSTEPIFIKIADLNLALNRPEQALTFCERAIDEGFLSSKILERIGVARLAMGDKDQAIVTWERANRILLQHSVCQKLASAYKDSGRDDEARRQEALAAHALGVEFYRQDQLDQAERELLKSWELHAEFERTPYYLGMIALARGQKADAESWFTRSLELNPGNGRAFAEREQLNREND